jgi:hypothetical protein
VVDLRREWPASADLEVAQRGSSQSPRGYSARTRALQLAAPLMHRAVSDPTPAGAALVRSPVEARGASWVRTLASIAGFSPRR